MLKEKLKTKYKELKAMEDLLYGEKIDGGSQKSFKIRKTQKFIDQACQSYFPNIKYEQIKFP